MFTPKQIAEVIEELDRSYISSDDDELQPTEQKVDKIVKKNLVTETSANKIDKMLALNQIKTQDILTQTIEEKEPKFVMPEITVGKSPRLNYLQTESDDISPLLGGRIKFVGKSPNFEINRMSDSLILKEHALNVKK